tara:strand:- start:192 stop:1472 length:1281 start_codon:yes stop_codon:yes gene_type:complete
MVKKRSIFIYIIYFLLIFIILTILSFNKNFFGIKENLYKKYPNLQTEFRRNLFKKKSVIQNLKNDYNYKFLPDTQFLKLNYTKKKIIFNDFYYSYRAQYPKKYYHNSFFIDQYEDSIIVTDYLGGIYKAKLKNLKNDKLKIITPDVIKSNLSNVRVLDSLIHEENLYISYFSENNNCKNLNIDVAKINTNFLKFDNLFNSKECPKYIQGGRMVFYKHDNTDGLLFTTSSAKLDELDGRPQDDNSVYGKVLFIDLITKNHIIFSKGHRNIQGLYANDDLILATEHGPRGGDEINKILFNKNYGWPIASYGEKYSVNNSKKSSYTKNHYSKGFEEPIFAFVPAIGISEIIKLPNTFSEIFNNNFIISSLYGYNIFRIKFDKDYTRVIFSEKIFIGDRIRDIKFNSQLDAMLLALEKNGEIGIITNADK